MTGAEPEVRFIAHGAVAQLVLNRPAKRNAVNPAMARLLEEAVDRLAGLRAHRVRQHAGVGVGVVGHHRRRHHDFDAVAQAASRGATDAPALRRRISELPGARVGADSLRFLISCGVHLDSRRYGPTIARLFRAGIAQLVERNLAKVEVGSSSLLSRSKTSQVVNDLQEFWYPAPGNSSHPEFR